MELKKKIKKNINLISRDSLTVKFEKIKKVFFTFIKFFSLIVFLFIFILVILNWSWINKKIKFWWKSNRGVINNTIEDQSSLSDGEIIPEDERFIITKIDINAPIVWMESDEEEEIQKYLKNGIGHYPGTAFPGEVGNCVLTGHSSNYLWVTGEYNDVFALLNNLVIGDKAIIYYKQKKYVYEIFEIEKVSIESIEVLESTSESILTLITCWPPGTNWQRLIVKAKQVTPDPSNNITPPHPHFLPLE